MVKTSKSDINDAQIKLIEVAAQTWGEENLNLLPDSGECKYITLNQLKEYGLLDKNQKDSNISEEFDDLKIKIETNTTEYGSLNIEYRMNEDDILGCENVYRTLPVSFAEDSWETIVENVKLGNISKYKVGDTKSITLESTDKDISGTYTVRIANISTPTECSEEGFSQTACGFVIEFFDIINEHEMNSFAVNEGGWKDSEMRSYVNDEIYNSLPETLKNSIIDTTVVSGYGSNDKTNFTTTDKLYLLSTKELYGTASTYDTLVNETRQLDYYKNEGVTISNTSDLSRYYYFSNIYWWLRSGNSSSDSSFYSVSLDGNGEPSESYEKIGVSPAFRIEYQNTFENDSWKTIVENVKGGNANKYNVGDEKEITLTSTDEDIAGTYTVRIANISTPEECNTTGFSQTACGFVIEFADIINTHVMNSTDTNIGGWKDSEMRSYVNNNIYNSLPTTLKNSIIDTTVVSSDVETNFTTTDKLYLLSTKEVWENGTSNTIDFDITRALTRQLDYYKNIGVTADNYSGAIKMYNNSNSYWWLRSAYSTDTPHYFYDVGGFGGCDHDNANYSTGVSPAFRLEMK